MIRNRVTLGRSLHYLMSKRTTVGIIVIGDEILKGSTKDTNSGFLATKLHQIGVQLKRVTVIGDDLNDIREEVAKQSAKYDIVITTGGVGPTHDDKTYQGLASAFDVKLETSEEILNAVTEYVHDRSVANQSFALKLSNIPANSTLLWGFNPKTGSRSPFPVVQINNVIAFPGVPMFFEKAFNSLKDQLFPPEKYPARFQETIYTINDEFKFSDSLDSIAAKFDKEVEIGSYPVIGNNYFKTKLIVESECTMSGQEAVEEIKAFLKDSRVFYDETPWVDTDKKMQDFITRQDEEFANKMTEANNIVNDILEKYPLDQIALSFNGGKDCTVLLHLMRRAVDKKYGPHAVIQGFHIMCDDQFPEATQFTIDAAKSYNIIVHEVPGPLKIGLERLKAKKPNIVAVFMGSRVTDPKGKYMKSPTEWTDADWPRVLRVCPILYWSYENVWRTLRGLCIPYCSLYDQGYTSLGGRENTFKNPLLKKILPDGREIYMPAYKLQEQDMERHGREL